MTIRLLPSAAMVGILENLTRFETIFQDFGKYTNLNAGFPIIHLLWTGTQEQLDTAIKEAQTI